MNNLLYIAIILIVIFVVASVTKFVAGALLHLLWVLAIIFLVVWAVKKIF